MKKVCCTPILATALMLASCAGAPRGASKAGFDFSKIKKIEVRAKDQIAPLVSRELLRGGISPMSKDESASDSDAILKVAVTRESPEKRYLIRSSKKSGTRQTSSGQAGNTLTTTVQFEEEAGHKPIQMEGKPSYTQTVFGAKDSQMIATYAQVFLTGELINPKNGEIIWAGSYSYEGLDLETALEGAVQGIIQEIPLAFR